MADKFSLDLPNGQYTTRLDDLVDNAANKQIQTSQAARQKMLDLQLASEAKQLELDNDLDTRSASQVLGDTVNAVALQGPMMVAQGAYGIADLVSRYNPYTLGNAIGNTLQGKGFQSDNIASLDEVVGLSENFAEAKKIARSFMSEQSQQSHRNVEQAGAVRAEGRDARIAEDMSDGTNEYLAIAKEEGMSLGKGLLDYADEPIAAANTALESVVQLFAGGAASRIGRNAAVKEGAKKAGRSTSEFIKTKAGRELVEKGGASGALAYTGLAEAGSNYVEARSSIMSMSHDDLSKISPQYEARVAELTPENATPKQVKQAQLAARSDIANNKADLTAAITAISALAIAKVTGSAKFEDTLFNPDTGLKSRPGRVAGRVLSGTAREAAEEGGQGATGTYASNQAQKQTVDPTQSLTEGVGTNAAAGIVAGGLSGGGVAAVTAAPTEVALAAKNSREKLLNIRDSKGTLRSERVQDAIKSGELEKVLDVKDPEYRPSEALAVLMSPVILKNLNTLKQQKAHQAKVKLHLDNQKAAIVKYAETVKGLTGKEKKKGEATLKKIRKDYVVNRDQYESLDAFVDKAQNRRAVDGAIKNVLKSTTRGEKTEKAIARIFGSTIGSKVTAAQATEFATSDLLTPQEKKIITLYAAKQKTAEQVNTDIIKGNASDPHYEGLPEFQANVQTGIDAKEKSTALTAFNKFSAFSDRHIAKYLAVKKAYDLWTDPKSTPAQKQEAKRLIKTVKLTNPKTNKQVPMYLSSGTAGLLKTMELEAATLQRGAQETAERVNQEFGADTVKYENKFDDKDVGKGQPEKNNEKKKTPLGIAKTIAESAAKLSGNKKNFRIKDSNKAAKATQFIGVGRKGSSTEFYEQTYAEAGLANTGNYSQADSVFVSVNGGNGGVKPVNSDGTLTTEYANLDKAIAAGSTIITDDVANTNRAYNSGERAIATYLENNGYERVGETGTWKKATQQSNKKTLDELFVELEAAMAERTAALAAPVNPDVLTDAENKRIKDAFDAVDAIRQEIRGTHNMSFADIDKRLNKNAPKGKRSELLKATINDSTVKYTIITTGADITGIEYTLENGDKYLIEGDALDPKLSSIQNIDAHIKAQEKSGSKILDDVAEQLNEFDALLEDDDLINSISGTIPEIMDFITVEFLKLLPQYQADLAQVPVDIQNEVNELTKEYEDNVSNEKSSAENELENTLATLERAYDEATSEVLDDETLTEAEQQEQNEDLKEQYEKDKAQAKKDNQKDLDETLADLKSEYEDDVNSVNSELEDRQTDVKENFKDSFERDVYHNIYPQFEEKAKKHIKDWIEEKTAEARSLVDPVYDSLTKEEQAELEDRYEETVGTIEEQANRNDPGQPNNSNDEYELTEEAHIEKLINSLDEQGNTTVEAPVIPEPVPEVVSQEDLVLIAEYVALVAASNIPVNDEGHINIGSTTKAMDAVRRRITNVQALTDELARYAANPDSYSVPPVTEGITLATLEDTVNFTVKAKLDWSALTGVVHGNGLSTINTYVNKMIAGMTNRMNKGEIVTQQLINDMVEQMNQGIADAIASPTDIAYDPADPYGYYNGVTIAQELGLTETSKNKLASNYAANYRSFKPKLLVSAILKASRHVVNYFDVSGPRINALTSFFQSKKLSKTNVLDKIPGFYSLYEKLIGPLGLNDKQVSGLKVLADFNGKFTDAFFQMFIQAPDGTKNIMRDDMFQLFINNNVDVELNSIEYLHQAIDPAVLAAMSTVAANWIATRSGSTVTLFDDDINNLLNRDEGTPVTKEERALLSKIGVGRNVLAESIGKDFMSAMGISGKRTAPGGVAPNMEMSIGNMIIGVMAKMDIITEDAIPTKKMSEMRGETFTDPNTERVVPFIRIITEEETIENSRGEEVQIDVVAAEIAEMSEALNAENSDSVMHDLFGIISYETGPTLQPLEEAPKIAKNTFTNVPAKLRAVLKKHMQRPNKVKRDVFAVFTALGKEGVYELEGLDVTYENEKHIKDHAGIRGKNDQIVRNVDDLFAFYDKVGLDTVFYFAHEVWKNMRMGMVGNTVNTQAYKLSRHAIGAEYHEMDITIGDLAQETRFKVALAESLGIGIDKQNVQATLDALEIKLQDADIRDSIPAILKSINGETLTELDKQLILAGAKAGGENAFSLDGLVAYARYTEVANTPGATFTTDLFQEVDGITNGVIIGLIQLVGGSKEKILGMIERGGVFSDGFTESYGEWLGDPSNKDSYVNMAEDWSNYLAGFISAAVDGATLTKPDKKDQSYQAKATRKFVRNNKELRSMFRNNSKTIEGSLQMLTSMVGEITRDFAKNPLMITNYGAAVDRVVLQFSERVVSEFYSKVANAKVANDQTALDLLASQMTTVLGIDAKLDLTLENALTFDLNKTFKDNKGNQIIKAEDKFMKIVSLSYGSALEKAIVDKYSDFMENRTLVNNQLRVMFEAFRLQYADQLNKATEAKGHELSREEREEITMSLMSTMPLFKSFFSDGLEDGITVMKSQSVRQYGNQEYTQKTIFRQSTGNNKTYKAVSSVQSWLDGGVSGAILGIHSMDAAVMGLLMDKYNGLNVHDAYAFGLHDAVEGTKELNKSFMTVMRDYSLMDEINESLNRVVDEVRKYDEANGTEIYKTLDQTIQIDDRSNPFYMSMTESSLAAFVEETNARTAEAAETKLEVLDAITDVVQYNLEGGNHTISDQADHRATREEAKIRAFLAEYTSAVFAGNLAKKDAIDLHDFISVVIAPLDLEGLIGMMNQDGSLNQRKLGLNKEFYKAHKQAIDAIVAKRWRTLTPVKDSEGNGTGSTNEPVVTETFTSEEVSVAVDVIGDKNKFISNSLKSIRVKMMNGATYVAAITSTVGKNNVDAFLNGARDALDKARVFLDKMKKNQSPEAIKQSQELEALVAAGDMKALMAYVTANATGSQKTIAAQIEVLLANSAVTLNIITPENEGTFRSNNRVINTSWLGWYSPANNSINIRSNAFAYTGMTMETILHELTHAVTHRVVEMAADPDSDLTPRQRAAVKELEKILEAVKRKATADGVLDHYGNAFDNVHELLSWGLTNEYFAGYLKSVTVGKSTIYQRLGKVILGLLGLGSTTENSDAMTEIMHLSQNAIFNSQDPIKFWGGTEIVPASNQPMEYRAPQNPFGEQAPADVERLSETAAMMEIMEGFFSGQKVKKGATDAEVSEFIENSSYVEAGYFRDLELETQGMDLDEKIAHINGIVVMFNYDNNLFLQYSKFDEKYAEAARKFKQEAKGTKDNVEPADYTADMVQFAYLGAAEKVNEIMEREPSEEQARALAAAIEARSNLASIYIHMDVTGSNYFDAVRDAQEREDSFNLYGVGQYMQSYGEDYTRRASTDTSKELHDLLIEPVPDIRKITLTAAKLIGPTSYAIAKLLVRAIPTELTFNVTTPRDTGVILDNDKRYNIKVGGHYNPRDNVIMITSMNNGRVSPETVFHELIHAATHNVFVTAELDPAMTELVAELEEILAAIQGVPHNLQGYANTIENISELIAWGYSNTAFQEYLTTITIGKVTGWQKFYRTLGKLLGLVSSVDLNAWEVLLKQVTPIQDNSMRVQVANPMAFGPILGSSIDSVSIDTNNFNAEFTDDLSGENVTSWWQALAGYGLTDGTQKVDNAVHTARLTNLVENVVAKVIRPITAHRNRVQADRTVGVFDQSTDSIYVSVNMQSPSLAGSLIMSAQEVGAHELMHAVLGSIDDKSKWASRELSRLYDQVAAEITIEDFIPAGMENDLDAIKVATDTYNYIFGSGIETTIDTYTDPTTGIEHTHVVAHHEHEFAVLGVTNELTIQAIQRVSERIKANSGTPADVSITDQLINMFQRLMDMIFNRVHKSETAELDVKLRILTEQIAGIDIRHRSKILAKVVPVAAKVGEGVGLVLDAVTWPMRKLTSSTALTNHRNTNVQKVGRFINGLPTRKFETYVERLQDVLRNKGMAEENAFNKFLVELKGSTDGNRLFHLLGSMSNMLIDQLRSRITSEVAAHVTATFHRALSKVERTALTRAILKTDFVTLMKSTDFFTPNLSDPLQGSYNIGNLLEVLTDPVALGIRIDALETEISVKFKKNKNWYIRQARSLGNFMATGEHTESVSFQNVDGIMSLMDSGLVQEGDHADATFLVDMLATLVSIRETSQEYKTTAANVIQSEFAANSRENGVTFLIQMHEHNKQHSLERSFAGNPMLMTKGWIKETYNPANNVTIARLSDEDDLKSQGFIKVKPVAREIGIDPNVEELWLYKSNTGVVARYMAGIVSFTNLTAKGAGLIDSLVQSGAEDPSITAAFNAQVIKARKVKIAKQIAKSATAGRPTAGTVMVPVRDDQGNMVDFRYIMSEENKLELLGRNDAIEHVMGTMEASIYDKANTATINSTLVQLSRRTFLDTYNDDPSRFVAIGPRVRSAHYREIYYMMPDAMRAEVERQWGSDTMYVPTELAVLIFGQRKWNISQLKKKDMPADSDKLTEMMVIVNNQLTLLLNTPTTIKIEQIFQEGIAMAKDAIVVKLGFVLLANTVSNFLLLFSKGVPFHTIVKDHAIAFSSARKYQKDLHKMNELIRIQKVVPGKGADPVIEAKIKRLATALYNNPVRDLVELGVHQSIVEDLDVVDEYFSAKSRFEQTGVGQAIVNNTPQPIKSAFKVLTMQHDTALYKVMRDATQMSDFAARYSLHKKNLKAGMTVEDSLFDITDTFINYDLPTSKFLQYGNDMGPFMFSKFFIRSQKVIFNLVKDNGDRLLLLMLAQYLFGVDVPDMMDGNALTTSVASRVNFDILDMLIQIVTAPMPVAAGTAVGAAIL